ncbi:MAG: hypothetical protein ACON4E_00680 [Flavobacteriales bacterium]
MKVEIDNHLDSFNYDIRKTGNARFIDQKVTPDVLYVIANCVIHFIDNSSNNFFSTKDIWESKFANDEVKYIFNKPDVMNSRARSEYDKFFAQPLKMLEYAKILDSKKIGNINYYSVSKRSILEYISFRERNCFDFINQYLIKVLSDSGIWNLFNNFYKSNTKENFNLLKDGFVEFMINYTKINKPTEPKRIFTKIINPLAHFKKSRGTERGFLSKDIIGFDELLYNRKNWRDIKKVKGQTRSGYEEEATKDLKKRQSAYTQFTMHQAKKLIEKRYQKISEVQDEYAIGDATQIHHIFPRNEFELIESYVENLIALTPTQHFTKAHPNNNTRRIDKAYQYVCLLSKCNSIKESTEVLFDGFYSKESFNFVLNTGLSTNIFTSDLSFEEIKNKLTSMYHGST